MINRKLFWDPDWSVEDNLGRLFGIIFAVFLPIAIIVGIAISVGD